MTSSTEPVGLRAMKEQVLSIVSSLPPATALAILDDLYAETAPSQSRRALLGARIALMKAGVVAAAPPEPEEEPVIVTIEPVEEPPPPPPALKPGRFKMVSLEDATRFLDFPAEPEPAAVAAEPAPDPVEPDWSEHSAFDDLQVSATADDAEVQVAIADDLADDPAFSLINILPDADQALPADTPVIEPEPDLDIAIVAPKKRKKTASAVEDAAALFGALADDSEPAVVTIDAVPVAEPEPVIEPEPEAVIEPPAPKKKQGKMKGALADGGLAAMAALLAADDAPVPPPAPQTDAKPKALDIDLSAQFAAFGPDKGD